MIRFVRLSEVALMPDRQTDGAAAFDIFANEDVTIRPGQPTWVSTGFGVEFPPSMVAQVWPRSGKSGQGFHIGAGLIDSDYRGEVKVMIHNLSYEVLQVKAGERIAQLTFVQLADTFAVEYSDEFATETARGAGGFGSTGG